MQLVSVIVPTFNREQVLLRALESVAQQIYGNWELIVVDDGSTDRSEKIFSEWANNPRLASKLNWISTGGNFGVSRARNAGAAQARGQWLAFLDSDDEWLPEKLALQMPLTASFKWIHGEEIWIRNGARVNPPQKYKKSGGRIFEKCVEICCVGASTVLIERELFAAQGGFREDFPVCEDYDLWLKLASRFEAGFVRDPVVRKFGGHADQLSTRFAGMDYFRCESLREQMDNPHISRAEREYVERTLIKKAEIVERGARKHGTPWALRL